jgi:hypothetical protein
VTSDADELIALMPFAQQLGMILEEAAPERVVASLPWQARLCTMTGILHGGALMSYGQCRRSVPKLEDHRILVPDVLRIEI